MTTAAAGVALGQKRDSSFRFAPPLSELNIPAPLTRILAALAIAHAVLAGGAFESELFTRYWRPDTSQRFWITGLIAINLVLGAVLLSGRLRYNFRLQRWVAVACLDLWAAATACGLSAREPTWQSAIRILGAAALLAAGVALASSRQVGLLLAKAVAWWHVLYAFGGLMSLAWFGDRNDIALLQTMLLLAAQVLLLRLVAQLEQSIPAAQVRRAGWQKDPSAAVALLGSLLGIGLAWGLDASPGTGRFLVGVGCGVVLGLAWIFAAGESPSVPHRSQQLEVPCVGALGAVARLLVCFVVTLGLGTALLSQVVGRGFLPGLGILSSLPAAMLLSAVFGICLAIALGREIARSRRQLLIADDTGFRIADDSGGRYLSYVDCGLGELRKTLWGAELILQTHDFQPTASYPLLDRGAALTAARALRRCEAVRSRSRRGVRRRLSALARPRGASLGSWTRSIRDLVRKQEHPYHDRTPPAEELVRILDDLCVPADERAGAAVALIALQHDSLVRDRLRQGHGPPLLAAAAVVAGMKLSEQALVDAAAFLEADDQIETLGVGRAASETT